MFSIQTKAHIGADGRLDVQLPAEYREQDVDVTIIIEPVEVVGDEQEKRDANGWPVGFLDRMYGSLAGDPLERLPQGEPETREAID